MHTVTYSMPCEQWFLQAGRNATASQTASNRLLLWHSRPQCLRLWECARKLRETLHQSSQNLAIWVSQRMLFYPTKTFCFFCIYFIAKVLCCFGIRAKEINGALEEFSGIQGSCGSCACWANTVKRFSVYFSLASLFLGNLRREAKVFIHTRLLRVNTITWKSKKNQLCVMRLKL